MIGWAAYFELENEEFKKEEQQALVEKYAKLQKKLVDKYNTLREETLEEFRDVDGSG